MLKLVIICCCLLIGLVQPQKKTCGPREVYKECGPSCEAKCADGPTKNGACVDECKKGCFCVGGLLRDENEKCVFLPDCQNAEEYTCPDNQYFSACAQPLTCRTCSNPDACQIDTCNKGCTCFPGYLRAIDGSCVPMEQCPKLNKTCGPREVYRECGPSCEAKCADGPTRNGGCVDECKEGCFCVGGLLRDENENCVFLPDCQNAEEYTCPDNQYFSTCAQPLTCRTCSNPRACQTYTCNKGCNCFSGYLRAIDGSCVPVEKCPKLNSESKCPINETIVSCVKPRWCNTCEIRGNCKFSSKTCQKGCDCEKEHFRNEYGFCIHEKECL